MDRCKQQHLLAYLVVCQMINWREDGYWLPPYEMTDAIFAWQKKNATIADCLTRISTAKRSVAVAITLLPQCRSWSTSDLKQAVQHRRADATPCFEQIRMLCRNQSQPAHLSRLAI